MKFHEFGDKNKPVIMMIHGGGNAWWNFLRQARALCSDYRVVLPTLDGHGEEYAADYVSTRDSARKLLAYIDKKCDGSVFALCGVSLGGQIVIELLTQRPDVTRKAIIDGCICYPQPAMARFSMAFIRIFRPLLFSRAACRFQLWAMKRFLPAKMRYPDEIANYYITNMPRLRKETLYTMYRTYMQEYRLQACVRRTTAQVMYWYGSKEMKCVKHSAQMFRELVPSCEIYEAQGYDHGYLAIYLPEEWLGIAKPFLES